MCAEYGEPSNGPHFLRQNPARNTSKKLLQQARTILKHYLPKAKHLQPLRPLVYTMELTEFTDVLVCGAGPVGLLTALGLSQHGIKTILLGKQGYIFTCCPPHC